VKTHNKMNFWIFFICVCMVGGTVVWTQNFVLPRVPRNYHLRPTSSSFCPGYLENRQGLDFCPGQPRLQSPILSFPTLLEWQMPTITPIFFPLRWSLTNFLPGMASSCNPSHLSLSSCYDYRYEPLVPSFKYS
jgi:hypothetical protein